jgi:hypothetical protein
MSHSYPPNSSDSNDDHSVTSPTPGDESEENKLMARRALIAAAGLGVVGAGIYVAPKILDGAKDLTAQQIENAFNAGKQAIINEILTLGQISLDVAAGSAKLADEFVHMFILPLAELLAIVTEDVLGFVAGVVEKTKDVVQWTGNDGKALDTLIAILHQWQASVKNFPDAIGQVSHNETNQAVQYLTQLKKTIESAKK